MTERALLRLRLQLHKRRKQGLRWSQPIWGSARLAGFLDEPASDADTNTADRQFVSAQTYCRFGANPARCSPVRMFGDDPLRDQEFEMAEVCAFPPSDFEFVPTTLSWEQPCWVSADFVLRPLTAAGREKFIFNIAFPHRWDAFAKASWEDQFWAAFAPRLTQVTGHYRDAWWQTLFDYHQKLKKQLSNTIPMFPEPFRFIPRQQFTNADLATVLCQKPDDLCIYLAFEKRSSEFGFLRIHSKMPGLGPQPNCLWFEKRMPDQLHREDVVMWFLATIERLPKKQRPDKVQPWVDRLMSFEPQLATPTGADKTWTGKPKIVLVFGPTSKVGYRGLTHFERRDISYIIRQNDIITIVGKERFEWVNQKTTEHERTFYLLAFDELAAQRVERQLLHGDKIHFGLSADIFGMVSRSAGIIHAINAPVETIKQLCVEPQFDLELLGDPKYKVKLYQLKKRQLG